MALRFAKVLEEEIEEAFFYPSELVKILKQLSPSGSVKRGGYNIFIYLDTSGLGIITSTIHLPFRR